MADDLDPTGNGADPATTVTRSPFPKRPTKRFTIDRAVVVESVRRRARDIEDDLNRGEWLEQRLQRYAKYRGWLPEKTFPWQSCSNVHIPLLQIAELRANAGLHNVVMTLRPLMSAKAERRDNVEREQKITELIDAQLFLEPGPELAERRIADFIAGGLQDGNAVAYTPWVRDERFVTSVHYLPPIPPDLAPSEYLEAAIAGTPDQPGILPAVSTIELDDVLDYRLYVAYSEQGKAREAEIEVYTGEDDALELVIKRETTIYDGPVMLPFPIESVLVPTRCTNLQPPSEYNPTGAPYVTIRIRYRLDEIKRLMGSGQFNWLDADGFAEIVGRAKSASGLGAQRPEGEELQEQKDTIEGREHREIDTAYTEDLAHLGVSFLLCFDRWDVDGDGLAEDVYWLVAEDAEVLCEGRLLTERWPAARPYRPLAEWCPIPVKDRWYGISLLELGESLYDLVKGTFDQSFDAWTIGNLPFFFYSASSKLNADILSIAPGQGTPVPGNPKETVYFPTLSQRDQSTAMGIIGLGVQFFERVMMQGDMQLGRVPTGKASALRTVGTTMALLQQGDVRSDQLLLRLFNGLRQVARNFHAMNRHLLPPNKEIRVLGWDGPKELGYRVIRDVTEIDADADFDFRPDFLNANPAVLHEALREVLGVMVTPLMYQLGINDPKLTYNMTRDFIRSLRLDTKRYSKAPAQEALPPLLAEEAISQITSGQEPLGMPMEGAGAHLTKLFQWVNSDTFGFLPPEHVPIAQRWMEQIGQRAQQEKIIAAAQQFQAALTAGGQAGGVPTTMAEPSVGGGEPGNPAALAAAMGG